MDLLDELAAERDIRRIVALYPQYADDVDAEAYAGLFTPDGVIEVRGKRTQGRAAIAEWVTSSTKARMQHAMFNAHVQIESETSASGSLDAMVSVKGEGGWAPGAAIRYVDRYEKTAEGWRFAERVLHTR